MSAVGDFLDDFVWMCVCVRESEYENKSCSSVYVCVSGREKETGRVRGKHVNEGVTHYSTNNANY